MYLYNRKKGLNIEHGCDFCSIFSVQSSASCSSISPKEQNRLFPIKYRVLSSNASSFLSCISMCVYTFEVKGWWISIFSRLISSCRAIFNNLASFSPSLHSYSVLKDHNFMVYSIKSAQNPTGVATPVHSQGKLILTNKVVTPLHTKSSCKFLFSFE